MYAQRGTAAQSGRTHHVMAKMSCDNVTTSDQSQRIHGWLASCADPALQQPSSRALTITSPKRKSAMSEFERTPKAKRARQVTNPLTPTASANKPSEDPPSLRASTTTSRSSSPSKRQRQIEAEFSRPAHIFHRRVGAIQWHEDNERQIPLLKELRESIHEGTPEPISTKTQEEINHLLSEVNRCHQRDGTEEMWSDNVVHPVLQMAKRFSSCRESIDVINVLVTYDSVRRNTDDARKTIDVHPTYLLPQRAQATASANPQKRRIDYTIGFPVAHDRRSTRKILQEAENHTLTQNMHKMIRDRALCAHVEIKTGPTASEDEARLQLFTWCAAGFAKQEELYLARNRKEIQEEDCQPVVEQLAPVPLWLWTKDAVDISIAVIDSANETIDVLQERRFAYDSGDAKTLLEIVQTMARVMDWGYTSYLPWFKKLIGEQELVLLTAPSNARS